MNTKLGEISENSQKHAVFGVRVAVWIQLHHVLEHWDPDEMILDQPMAQWLST